MTISSGLSTNKVGLVAAYDAGNWKSVRPGRSLISWSSWTAGTGSVTGYTVNESPAGENTRSVSTDPYGDQSMVWGTFPSGNNNEDGGWNGSYVTVDPTKLYRYSVWVRRTSSTTGGTFYFGLYTSSSTVYDLSGVSQNNPYWDYRNIAAYTQNQWYLVVGHVYPYSYTGTAPHANSGTWNTSGTKVLTLNGNLPSGAGDCKWTSNTTTASHRTYHFYCTDSTSRLEFFQPRIDLIDGREIPLATLVASNVEKQCLNLVSTSNAGKLSPNITVVNNSLVYNGVDCSTDCGSLTSHLNGATNGLTVSAVIYPTVAGIKCILENGTNYITNSFYLFQENASYFTFEVADGVLYDGVYANFVYSINTWYHIVGVWAPGQRVEMYVNGVLVSGTRVNNGAPISAIQVGNTNLFIGARAGNQYFFSGNIATASVYANVALSSDQVKQNFNAQRGRFGL